MRLRQKPMTVLGAVLAVAMLVASARHDVTHGTTVARGLNGPQGVLVGKDGSVYVVDSGTGGRNSLSFTYQGRKVSSKYGNTARVYQIREGRTRILAHLPSATGPEGNTGGGRLAIIGDQLYVSSGGWFSELGPKPLPRMDAILQVNRDGSTPVVADLWKLESGQNPDRNALDSHAYGIAAGPDGALWIADAAGNHLSRLDPRTRALSLVAVFDGVAFPEGAPLGPEFAKGNPGRGGRMETDPVPTGIAFDDGGNAYVTLLPGAPFLPGSGKVVKVTPQGRKSDFATGLTMPTDIRRGPDGNFYAVQFAQTGKQGPMPASGSVVRIGPDGRAETVLDKLMFPTSIAFDAGGDAYVAVGGAGAPGSGGVVMYRGLAMKGM